LNLWLRFRDELESQTFGDELEHRIGLGAGVLTFRLTDDIGEEEVAILGTDAGHVDGFVLSFELFGGGFDDALLADFVAVGAGRAVSDDDAFLVTFAAGAAFLGSCRAPFVVPFVAGRVEGSAGGVGLCILGRWAGICVGLCLGDLGVLGLLAPVCLRVGAHCCREGVDGMRRGELRIDLRNGTEVGEDVRRRGGEFGLVRGEGGDQGSYLSPASVFKSGRRTSVYCGCPLLTNRLHRRNRLYQRL
jgi:hypothetical protein